MTDTADKRRLALVLWNGDVGGAEVLSAALADQMSQLGVEATLVFIEDPHPLVGRLVGPSMPHRALGFSRGRDVLRHPRRYAAEVARAGPDGALLVTCGFMGATLRAGGYSAPIIAVEHGSILEAQPDSWVRRTLGWMDRAGGARADDIEVAVSDFILERMRQRPHAAILRRIYNGIDPDQYKAARAPLDGKRDEDCVVAFAGRLVCGKGPDYLLEAVARLRAKRRMRLLIAGDGPERPRLEDLAQALDIRDTVQFLGLSHEMPAFWQMCDIAAVPSAEFIEACPMTPLEAMASSKPVVATRNGGLPELVVDGETGLLVPPGDDTALASALERYANSSELRLAHGSQGRARVVRNFHINNCARRYLELFDEIVES